VIEPEKLPVMDALWAPTVELNFELDLRERLRHVVGLLRDILRLLLALRGRRELFLLLLRKDFLVAIGQTPWN
jgi:hypothetical protein